MGQIRPAEKSKEWPVDMPKAPATMLIDDIDKIIIYWYGMHVKDQPICYSIISFPQSHHIEHCKIH